MEISMLVKVCTLDQTPIEHSLCYLTLVETVGEERARLWTEDIEVPGDT